MMLSYTICWRALIACCYYVDAPGGIMIVSPGSKHEDCSRQGTLGSLLSDLLVVIVVVPAQVQVPAVLGQSPC